MKALEQLDAWIGRRVRTWSSRIAGDPRRSELLEIRRDILSEVRDHIQPTGEGRSIFPYSVIEICIAAEDNAHRAVMERAFMQGSELQETVYLLLTEAGCPIPVGLTVNVSVENSAGSSCGQPFEINFGNERARVESATPEVRTAAKLTVLRGEADAAEYVIDSDLVNLGRLKEVVSDKDGLRRRNHVAFAESETTVSREHAFIRYEHEARRFRLFDSMSHCGTRVFRDGRRLDVPKDPARGLQLQSGDEIHLGEARLRFDLDTARQRLD